MEFIRHSYERKFIEIRETHAMKVGEIDTFGERFDAAGSDREIDLCHVSNSVTGRPGGITMGRPVKRSKAKKQRSPSKPKSRKKMAGRKDNTSAPALLQAKEALERKTTELALSLSMMQATLDSTTDAIVVTDMSGHVRNFNEKYARMMGVTREELKKA